MKNKSPGPLPTLDLHGRTTDEVPDLVDRFLRSAEQRGATKARIMTGKGTGKILNAVTHYLKMGHYQWKYDTTPSGSENQGVLLVLLN